LDNAREPENAETSLDSWLLDSSTPELFPSQWRDPERLNMTRKPVLTLGTSLICGAAWAGNNLVENPNQAIWKFSQDLDVPHIAWAKPLAVEPVRATIAAPRGAYRDAVELCQRVTIEANRIMTSSFTEAASSCRVMRRSVFRVWLRQPCVIPSAFIAPVSGSPC